MMPVTRLEGLTWAKSPVAALVFLAAICRGQAEQHGIIAVAGLAAGNTAQPETITIHWWRVLAVIIYVVLVHALAAREVARVARRIRRKVFGDSVGAERVFATNADADTIPDRQDSPDLPVQEISGQVFGADSADESPETEAAIERLRSRSKATTEISEASALLIRSENVQLREMLRARRLPYSTGAKAELTARLLTSTSRPSNAQLALIWRLILEDHTLEGVQPEDVESKSSATRWIETAIAHRRRSAASGSSRRI